MATRPSGRSRRPEDDRGPDTRRRSSSWPRNYQAEPGLGRRLLGTGVHEHPAAVSVSHRFLLNLWRTATLPQAFDNSVPVGRRVLLQVQVLDHFNSPVQDCRDPRLPGPGAYTSARRSRRLREDQRARPGNNVIARTNRQGVATFHIVGTKRDIVPTTLSAHLLNKQADYVYGSSGQIYSFHGSRLFSRPVRRALEPVCGVRTTFSTQL